MQAPDQTLVSSDKNGIHLNVSYLTDDLKPDDSHIPYTLQLQHEDDISIQLLELYQELLPSKESHHKRFQFIKSIEGLLNTEWPNHDIKVNVFGSSVNDLGTSSSDVDLCITTPWNGLRNIKVLAKLFRKCGMQQVICVPHAKVPIVRLFDQKLLLSCDINVNNTLALLNTKMIKTYVSIDPRVRPLVMFIKYWTKQRSLNDAAMGGTLSSYTWTCMVINFLQQREPPILPAIHQISNGKKENSHFFDGLERLRGFGSKNYESLGGLLFAFFRHYAVEFNYDDQVVSVRQGGYLTKAEKGWDTGRNKISLCVEEPCNMSRNLGNSADATSVLGLRCEFQRALEMLTAGESLIKICALYRPTFSAIDHSLSLTLSQRSSISPNTTSSHSNRRKSTSDRINTCKAASENNQYSFYKYTSPTSPKPQYMSKPYHRQIPSTALDLKHSNLSLQPKHSKMLPVQNSISINQKTDQPTLNKKPTKRESIGMGNLSTAMFVTGHHSSRRCNTAKNHIPQEEDKFALLAQVITINIPSSSKTHSKNSPTVANISDTSTGKSQNRQQKNSLKIPSSSSSTKQRKKKHNINFRT